MSKIHAKIINKIKNMKELNSRFGIEKLMDYYKKENEL